MAVLQFEPIAVHVWNGCVAVQTSRHSPLDVSLIRRRRQEHIAIVTPHGTCIHSYVHSLSLTSCWCVFPAVVTKVNDQELYIVVNAGCREKDLAHIGKHLQAYKVGQLE